MQKKMTSLKELKLVGMTTRTNNAELLEADPEANKIAAIVQKYFQHRLGEKINRRRNPGATYCVYTNYESDVHGDYTYFIGEEVTAFEDIDEEFETLIIPPQNYVKFTNQPGPMPNVCIQMWQSIWDMNASELGGERAYIADFEVYDERSQDRTNATLDIYIGIRK